MPRSVIVFAGVFAMAGMLYWQVSMFLPWGVYWGAVLVLAFFLASLARPPRSHPGPRGGGFLCDSCKYNYGDVCTRPERPNAIECPDYRSRD